jgi:hypothetical protein
MTRYLEIARRIVAEQGSQRVTEPVATNATIELPVGDPYAERVRGALLELNRPNYPAGMIRWLDATHPDRYAELTSHIPDEIHQLWTERVPLEQFEAVLTRLVSLHAECCNLCGAARKESGSVPKTSQLNFGTPPDHGGAK